MERIQTTMVTMMIMNMILLFMMMMMMMIHTTMSFTTNPVRNQPQQDCQQYEHQRPKQQRRRPLLVPQSRFQRQQRQDVITTISLAARRRNTNNSNNNKNRRQHAKNNDVLSIEKDLYQRGYFPIIGSDETGRGCIAGPVITVSCCINSNINNDDNKNNWDEYVPIDGVNDSKQLSSEERRRIYDYIRENQHMYSYSIAQRSNEDIDKSNILIATMDCFRESIENVATKLLNIDENDDEDETNDDDNDTGINTYQPYSIVDGKKGPKLNIKLPSRTWVKADEEVYTVSLASIIAKVTRDELAVNEWHTLYPQYQFDVNKGYATEQHIEAIHKYGPCPIHRMSFKSLKGFSDSTSYVL